MKKPIWNSMLDAEMNVRYWNHLSNKYNCKNLFAKVLLAITTSGTVLSWLFIEDKQFLWKLLSTAAASVSIIYLFLNWEKWIERMYILKKEWEQIKNEYELLWQKIEKNSSELEEQYKRIKDKEIYVAYIGSGLHNDKKELISKCQKEVLRSRGLIKM